MADSPTRRAFLKRVGSASLAPLALWGCERGGRPGAEPRASETTSITRPVLLPWSDAAIRIAAPMAELPMAYVSMERRRIYVDYDFRDRVYWALRAHISVSTGVWRIPLPGDPETVPITPGDPLREFEEFALRDWDPTIRPTEGDIRIRGGRAVGTLFEFICAPLLGSGDFFSASNIRIESCLSPGDDACREDFMNIGVAERHRDQACAVGTGRVGLMTWACR